MRNDIIRLISADAETDPSVVFLTGDLGFSVVEPLRDALGQRFINAGVAEANMISVAAGLAACGFRSFAYSIAPFVTMRCFEQIRNDVCYQDRAVRLIGVGAGYSYGSLGPSHHALEDATLMASLPGMMVLNPGCVGELEQMYEATRTLAVPLYFRIGREQGPDLAVSPFAPGDAAIVYRHGGDSVAMNLVASGALLDTALTAAQGLADAGVPARVISVPVLTPFPTAALLDRLASAPVLSLFEGFAGNPLETGVMAALLARGWRYGFAAANAGCSFPRVVGDTAALRRTAGLDVDTIVARARALV